MNVTTQKLHEIGQSLWLDNITRGLLASGTLQRYIRSYRSRVLLRTPRSSIMPSRTVTTTTTPSARK
jgi:hypothetical protein